MGTVFFCFMAFLLAAYVVLDGFDLGAGVLHLFVARREAERREVLAAIGPFWDGNEVWLLASGASLLVAFPRALSAGVSGFYLAIFLVVWCLILRGISIEFRSHVTDRLWRGSWDCVFAVASALLPVFLGVALGNLLRGVPLSPDGWFTLTLFTDFSAHEPVGILDWYTALVGLFALVVLAGHGGMFLAWKTAGDVRARSRAAGRRLLLGVTLLWPVVTLATLRVNPRFFDALLSRPVAWLLGAVALVGLAITFTSLSRGEDLAAFCGSCAFVAGLSGATAACAFPVLLRATGGDALSLTAGNAGGDPAGLRTALVWFSIGMPLAVLYFVTVLRIHRGKAVPARDGEGY